LLQMFYVPYARQSNNFLATVANFGLVLTFVASFG